MSPVRVTFSEDFVASNARLGSNPCDFLAHHEDFAVFRDFDFHVAERFADRSEFVTVRCVGGRAAVFQASPSPLALRFRVNVCDWQFLKGSLPLTLKLRRPPSPSRKRE